MWFDLTMLSSIARAQSLSDVPDALSSKTTSGFENQFTRGTEVSSVQG